MAGKPEVNSILEIRTSQSSSVRSQSPYRPAARSSLDSDHKICRVYMGKTGVQIPLWALNV
jgi:hypothetical protein